MCRLLGYCARAAEPVSRLLTEEGLRDFTAMSAFHSDGWGMAWYGAGGGPQVRKSVRRATDEPAYSRLAHRALGDLGLVHLRWATPGLALGHDNCHPFIRGPYAMAHNGAIHPQPRLPDMLAPEWEGRVAGTTDSERYFLHIMWELERCGGDVATAVARTISSIAGRYDVNSLNAILLSPDTMYAISWHDPARIPGEQLRRRGMGTTDEEIAGYFHLAYRQTGDAVVAASSGWPQPGWTVLPNGCMLTVDRATLAAEVLSVTPAGAAAAPG
jgi:predicted glutamine amidotransferase